MENKDILTILNEKFGDTIIADILRKGEIGAVGTHVEDGPVMEITYVDGKKLDIKGKEKIITWVEDYMKIKPVIKVINYLRRTNGSGHIVEHIGWHESGDYLLRQLFNQGDKGYRQHKYEVEKEYEVVDKSEVDKLERHTCGRRMGEMGPWGRVENIDTWKPGVVRTCSFCGSIHPMDLIEKIKVMGFGVIERTDKNYKWYVQNHKYYRQHDTDEFIKAYNAELDGIKKELGKEEKPDIEYKEQPPADQCLGDG